MREHYQERLGEVADRVVTMATEVVGIVEAANRALLDADLAAAEDALSRHPALRGMQDDADQLILELLALQAPVAGDLRQVISAMRITADLERMGGLAGHIAKIARMRYPEHAVPDDMEPTFRAKAELAAEMTRSAGQALAERDVDRCVRLAADDERMNTLHRSMFTVMLAEDWTGTVEQGVDLALLGRYYERIADHAVLIGAHVAFLVSGDPAHLGTIPR